CARDGTVLQYLDWVFPDYFDYW
nr:immunoglobulin heavy chain junction region [Macaca mulatta]MOV41814.1 immunoglobulin heavy chain junction region [Macaca mulatta]MOV46799.1 immunoglobulin heavy chain junction region [Macaca mulatta]